MGPESLKPLQAQSLVNVEVSTSPTESEKSAAPLPPPSEKNAYRRTKPRNVIGLETSVDRSPVVATSVFISLPNAEAIALFRSE